MHSQYIYSNLLSPRQRSNPLQLAIQIPKERGHVRHVSWVAATATGEPGVHLSDSWGGEGKGEVCAVNEHKDFFHCITPGPRPPDGHRRRPGNAGPAPHSRTPTPAGPQPASPAAARGPGPCYPEPRGDPLVRLDFCSDFHRSQVGVTRSECPPGPAGLR